MLQISDPNLLHDESVQKLSTHTDIDALDSQTTIIHEILLLNKNP